MTTVRVVGGGLAGCEAAWQLAQAGHDVTLIEQKPHKRTPAQVTNRLCELVCSNSLRSANVENAVGLIKEELRRGGSLVLRPFDRRHGVYGGNGSELFEDRSHNLWLGLSGGAVRLSLRGFTTYDESDGMKRPLGDFR